MLDGMKRGSVLIQPQLSTHGASAATLAPVIEIFLQQRLPCLFTHYRRAQYTVSLAPFMGAKPSEAYFNTVL